MKAHKGADMNEKVSKNRVCLDTFENFSDLLKQ